MENKDPIPVSPSLTIDFLIVGQGLAGTLLTYFLQQAGKKVLVIDELRQNSASKIAAGIINPITGRRYVKSWKIEALLPFARSTYQSLEQLFSQVFFRDRTVIRTLFNHREENDWLARSGDPDYQPYLIEEANLGAYQTKMQPAFSYGEIAGAAQVSIHQLVETYRNRLLEQASLIEEAFDYSAVVLKEDSIQYKSIIARQVIFCEGRSGVTNPYFNYLPFNLTKGEVLIIRIPNVDFQKLLKHRILLVPLGGDQYWVGSTYDRDFEDDLPTIEGKNYLEERLQALLEVPFEILEHRAAIRPTVKDRRPFLGLHPKFPQLGIFNGLGAKGASLGPYFAKQMCDFLLGQSSLDPQVDINRFEKLNHS